MFRFVVCCFEQ